MAALFESLLTKVKLTQRSTYLLAQDLAKALGFGILSNPLSESLTIKDKL